MTEDEAKTKVCCGSPAVAVAIVSTGGAMAGAPIGADANPLCIASACMAWRWDLAGAHRIEADAEFQRTGHHKSPTEGRCGLAGAPQ